MNTQKPKRTRRKKPEEKKIKSHYVRINKEIFQQVQKVADQTGTSPRKLIESILMNTCTPLKDFGFKNVPEKCTIVSLKRSPTN